MKILEITENCIEVSTGNSTATVLLLPEDFSKLNRLGVKALSVIFQRNKANSIKFTLKKRNYYLGRFLMQAKCGLDVDHKDRNPCNNLQSNLRLVSRRVNCFNKQRKYLLGVTKLRSEFQITKPWRAQIKVKNKHVHLGCFLTQEAAHEAYLIKLKQLYPNDYALHTN